MTPRPLPALAIFLFAGLLLPEAAACQSRAATPLRIEPRTEYLHDPVGIDSRQPRFSWRLEAGEAGLAQQGYLLTVSKDANDLKSGTGALWRTQSASADQLAVYAGPALKPFTTYHWQVTLRDSRGRTHASPVARFETGMMDASDWKGAWISDDGSVDLRPAPCFRRSFELRKPVRSARAYVACGGLFELHVNGRRIGDHMLDPTYTRFDRRNLYVTHDITDAVRQGANAVGLVLGNGWYNHQSTAVWYFDRAPWRNRPTVCADIRITYEDGTSEVIATGKDWRTHTGPVVFNSIYTAEHHDARLALGRWTEAGYADSAWKRPILRSAPSDRIVAQALHPIRKVEAIPARSVRRFSDTLYVFDIGRNIAGISELRVRGPRGTVLRLKHGERLRPDGRVDQSNIDVHYRPRDEGDPFQTDVFTLAGGGDEVFSPSFNYKGFQYVEVSASEPLRLGRDDLKAWFLHSDVPPAGRITSSNPTLDAIWRATNASYLSNLFGYPTDCPQREKNGWTGDAHIASETGLYNFDGITVYEKWMADHRDEQQPNGVLPSIIPTGGWGYEWGNGPDWTSTIAIIPWNLYLFYGDRRALSDNYDNMRRYVDRITAVSPGGTTTWGLGDWVPVKSKAPVELTSTAYYYLDAVIVSKAAALLGRTRDAEAYRALAARIRDAFNARFFRAGTALYGSGLQTELCVPLHMGLVPEAYRQAVADNLAKRVVTDGKHLDVGLLGTKSLLNALSENGHADLAYEVALQESFPSWGWWIRNGATTLFENWPIDAKSDISMNHIMFGEVGAWFWKALAGLRPAEDAPGFATVRVEPHFVKGLDRFEAEYLSVRGRIGSAWVREADGIRYRLDLPPNTRARLRLDLREGQRLVVDGKDRAYRAGMLLGPGPHELRIGR
jgi:alpha-L-rhamnosidase